MEKDNILEVKNLHKRFASKGVVVKAVTDVSFSVREGETIGIVGESGCGKTTLGRCIVRAYEASEGEVLYRTADGEELDFLKVDRKKLKSIRKEIQMIFQDPYSSLDPRMTVLDIIKEPIKANYPRMPKDEMDQLAKDMAEKVGLNPSYLMRYPHAFSGGQRQRIGIARALVLQPRIIVCDEAVSALDVSIQAQVVNILMKLQEELGLTYVFIGHDLSVVRFISDDVVVLYLGKVMELTSAEELYDNPLHPYTRALISAAPIPNPTVDRARERILLKGEIPSPINPPKGCNFCTRCQYADERCREQEPSFEDVGGGHMVACHKVKEFM